MPSRSLVGAALLLLALPAAASSASPARVAARCSTSALTLRLHAAGAAAGSTYYRLALTNRSSATCSLFGYPGVSAVRAGGAQLGSPARRNPQHPARLVVLRQGATAVAIVQVVDVHNFPPAVCRARRAAGLRIYPPGSYTSKVVPVRFPVCSTSRASLSVEAVA